jgi:hypothetical protein
VNAIKEVALLGMAAWPRLCWDSPRDRFIGPLTIVGVDLDEGRVRNGSAFFVSRDADLRR